MTASATKQHVTVCIGKAGQIVGQLTYVKEGAREYSAFAYDNTWLSDPARFEVSPDLALVTGHQSRRAPSRDDSCFHLALTTCKTWAFFTSGKASGDWRHISM